MTRLFELIVALIIVAVLALVVGVLLPSTGHIERSVEVSKDIRHVYDVFDNYRRFPDYSGLGAFDPGAKYQQSEDKWYGPGASISWTGNEEAGAGKLTIASAEPDFDAVEDAGKATIVWDLDNDWHGTNKHFTIKLKRTGRSQKLVKIDWAYDVDYGWSLINRYSGLYINGNPDTLIKYSLENFENVLASVPNISYSDLHPKIVDTPQQPVLLVSTKAKRNLSELDAASDTAMERIKAAMKKLGVHQAGPRIRITTNYGDENYTFDVAVPIDTDTLTLDGKDYTLSVPKSPATDAAGGAASVAGASVASADSSATPAEASSADNADDDDVGPKPGTMDDEGRLVVDGKVRGLLVFGGKALEAVWYGSPAGVPATRKSLQAYAMTHGYPFDSVNENMRMYDLQVRADGSKNDEGEEVAYDEQAFKIYLPLKDAPEQTPEQAAGMEVEDPFAESGDDEGEPSGASSVPAGASSAPADASSAPAEAASAD